VIINLRVKSTNLTAVKYNSFIVYIHYKVNLDACVNEPLDETQVSELYLDRQVMLTS